MRKVRRNFKLRVKYHGKLREFKRLVKMVKGDRKRAKRIWRKAAKYHGRTRIPYKGFRKLPRRAHAKRHGKKRAHKARRHHSAKRHHKARKHTAKRAHKARKAHKAKRKMSPAMRARAALVKKVWKEGSKTRAKLMAMPRSRRMSAAAKMVAKLAAN
jgi:hypothetical protein